MSMALPGLAAALSPRQQNPPTTSAATGTAFIGAYNFVNHTFQIVVTVSGVAPADVTGIHIHRGQLDVNGPVIVDFSAGPLTPAGSGFTISRPACRSAPARVAQP
jgi:hypothetical protein